MNLNNNPTHEQLRDLLRDCDDMAGHHLLWVKKNGEVKLSRIPVRDDPASFHDANMRLRCETFLAGNEYVGPEAADDDRWVSELFDRLLEEWPKAKANPEVAYVGKF